MKRVSSGSPRSCRARALTVKPARACTTSSSSRCVRAHWPAARAALAPSARSHPTSTGDLQVRNASTSLIKKSARAWFRRELSVRHRPSLSPCGDRGSCGENPIFNATHHIMYIKTPRYMLYIYAATYYVLAKSSRFFLLKYCILLVHFVKIRSFVSIGSFS